MQRKTLDDIFSDLPQGSTTTQRAPANSGRRSLDDIFSDVPQGATSTNLTVSDIKDMGNKGAFARVSSFAKSAAKNIAEPFVITGATGLAAIEDTYNLARGNKEATSRTVTGYNVPGFGQIKPVSIEEPERVLGTGAAIASTLAGGGAAKNIAQTGTTTALRTVVKQGVKEGAILGGVQGFGTGIQEEGATPMSVAGNVLEGAAFGGTVGGVVAGGSNILSRGGRAANRADQVSRAAKEAEQEALDIVAPKMTNKVKEEALSEGRVASRGMLSKQVITPSRLDTEVAQSVQGLVSKKALPIENIKAVKTGIKDIAQRYVKPVLEANPRPYNLNTFKARLSDLKMPTLFKADPTLERTYQLVQQRAAEIADEFPKTKLGSWQARQAFDDAVEREFPRVFDGSTQDNVIKHAVNDVRGAWNDFIVEGIPGSESVKNAFKQMSRMYQAIDNIAEKGASDVGTNAVQRFVKSHPVAKEALKYAAGGSAALTGAKALSE